MTEVDNSRLQVKNTQNRKGQSAKWDASPVRHVC